MVQGKLTTHVLDTASGLPAAGLGIALYREASGKFEIVKKVETNDDGRCDEPLLMDDEFAVGIYELRFEAGDYLRRCKIELEDPAFLDVILIRFGIADQNKHYHVPLLLSPYGYSTYRGS